MSIVARNRRGFCEHVDPAAVPAELPKDVPDRVRRPADVVLYAQALAQGWPIGREVREDTVDRLHRVVKYVNDPRAVVRASAVLIDASRVNLASVKTALEVRSNRNAFQEEHPENPTAKQIMDGRKADERKEAKKRKQAKLQSLYDTAFYFGTGRGLNDEKANRFASAFMDLVKRGEVSTNGDDEWILNNHFKNCTFREVREIFEEMASPGRA